MVCPIRLLLPVQSAFPVSSRAARAFRMDCDDVFFCSLAKEAPTRGVYQRILAGLFDSCSGAVIRERARASLFPVDAGFNRDDSALADAGTTSEMTINQRPTELDNPPRACAGRRKLLHGTGVKRKLCLIGFCRGKTARPCNGNSRHLICGVHYRDGHHGPARVPMAGSKLGAIQQFEK